MLQLNLFLNSIKEKYISIFLWSHLQYQAFSVNLVWLLNLDNYYNKTDKVIRFDILFQSTLLEWRTVFWISFAVIMATNIIYVIFASAKVQPWNDLTTLNEKETIGLNSKSVHWMIIIKRKTFLFSFFSCK